MVCEIDTKGGRIKVSGALSGTDFRKFLATIHSIVNKLSYKSIFVDFTELSSIFAPTALPIAVDLRRYVDEGIDVTVELPNELKLARLFQNTNWANIMSPSQFAESNYNIDHLPALAFSSDDEHFRIVDELVEKFLGLMPGLNKGNFIALEWALNELTDNVLAHSQSRNGGFVQCTVFKEKSIIEFVVCDSGLGIPETLRRAHSELSSDIAALDKAIREGITRNSETNRGNGLYGSFRIAQESDGEFEIHSGYAKLQYRPRYGLRVSKEQIPFHGTAIICRINCATEALLEKALRFGGKPHVPAMSYLDRQAEASAHRINLLEHSRNFVSRDAARFVRTKVENYIAMGAQQVIIDCRGVELVTSSYADELFGKLFGSMGPMEFMSRVQVVNTVAVVRSLIDRALRQRTS